MVHEIALEPDLVATWKSREAQAHLRDSVGVGNPRIVSGFPSITAWRDAVLKAVGPLEPAAKSRFEAFVQQLSLNSTFRRGTRPVPGATWQDDAVVEHARIPFDAIICRQKTVAETVAEEVIWANASPWCLERGYSVSRQAAEYARALGPMIRKAWDIAIVDPHFTPSAERFVAPLEAILTETMKHRGSQGPNVKVALLTTNDSVAAQFQLLARRVPTGLRLKVIRYEAREEKDHNRYVLTELGGVSFGTGVDQGSPRETDDLLLLSPGVLALRTRQYVQRNEGFQFEDVTTVVGTKRVA